MNLGEKRKQEFGIDTHLYPFTSNVVTLPNGQMMHYLDEGSGPVLLMLHGTPTWSFLYRHQVSALSDHFRCIVPDYPGFGLSDKHRDGDYKPQDLNRAVRFLIDRLALDDITLAVHDFGGPVGIPLIQQQPARFRQLILFNTWLWSLQNHPMANRIDKIIRSSFGRFMYLYLNASPRLLVRQGFHDQSKLTRNILSHYTSVFPRKKERFGPYRLAESLLGESEWYNQLWQQRDTLQSVKTSIIWGTKDKFLTPDFLETWQNALPSAETFQVEAGHFLMEEAHEEVTAILTSFKSNKLASKAAS